MKKILFLDDNEDRHVAFTRQTQGLNLDVWHVYNVKDAIKRLDDNQFDIVFLDHDLEDIYYTKDAQDNPIEHENTGLDVAKYIVNNLNEDRLPKLCVIHSWNSNGSTNMYHVLSRKILCTKVPFEVGVFSYFGSLVKKLAE